MIPEAYRVMSKLVKVLRSTESPSESPIELLSTNILHIDADSVVYVDLNDVTDDPVGVFNYLESLGYIRIIKSDDPVYYLTYEGLHARWITFENTLKSFILPIVVSLATTLLTLCIRALL